MITSHFPNLELCKTLTESNFPDTEHIMITPYEKNRPTEVTFKVIESLKAHWYDGECEQYKCPSVMELLDRIQLNKKYTIDIDKNGEVYSVMIFANKIDEFTRKCPIFSGTLPDTLSKMWLWLKKNNYLP